MFGKLHSGDLNVPLLGYFVADFKSPTRGRWWLDGANSGCGSYELFAGSVHVVWDVDHRGCALLAFLTGWIIDSPSIMFASFE